VSGGESLQHCSAMRSASCGACKPGPHRAPGNSPWPIGVTSVGIHERSAREKISHVMNGAAHVMNNEATRKYLQGLKRLLTFMQRAHPTDPSRSVEFDGYKDAGRGIIGGGSDKQARPLRRTGPLPNVCFVHAALLWMQQGDAACLLPVSSLSLLAWCVRMGNLSTGVYREHPRYREICLRLKLKSRVFYCHSCMESHFGEDISHSENGIWNLN